MHSYFILLLATTFIPKGMCVMCYECTTIFDEDGECGDDFEPEDIDKTECDGDDICFIHVSPEILNFPEIWQRGCVESTFCDKLQEFNEHCLTCEEDLCNKSPSTLPPSLFVAAILLYAII